VTEDIETSPAPALADGSSNVTDTLSLQQRAAQLADERPEVAAGAAFAGGLVLALILKRFAR
jgi:hypothetical protein